MTTKWWSFAGTTLIAAVLSLSPAIVGGQPEGEPDVTTAGASESQAATETQEEARALLQGMAEFLSKTPRFSVKIRCGYDVVQESGQKIEFNEVRTITVNRPDRLRVESEHSDGAKHLVLFDGKEIAVLSSPQNVYATTSKPGTIDEAVAYFRRDLHMRLPLAALVVNQLPADFERRVQSIDYVEETSILGVPAHHLAGRTATVDFQMWVSDGEQPLPQRVVLTYKGEDGQPQFWAQFSDWNLSPEITDATFTFTPPPGAQKIAFLAQLPRGAAPPTQAAEPAGEKP